MKSTALLFIGACICPAQDARSLVAHAVAADDRSDRLARNYTYKLRDEVRELDASGSVKSVHSTLDEILYVGGKRYFHPLEKDDKPLTAAEARREQAKLDRAVAASAHITDAERDKRIADEERARARSRAQFRGIPDAYDFKIIGEEVLDGRDTYEISASPRADYRGPIRDILRSLEGTLWIDKKDLIWVKFEAEVLKSFSLGWFLARVSDGTHLSYEMMRVNDELWVPKEVSLKASARLALVKKVNVEQQITFSDYRKFETDSRVLAAGEDP
jgi:hypothetical protein